eukprot:CAMPEP_0179098580 /NCGR_PEP_ID=MMETSP0796-20121207/45437_1 /TAXON_ID=73915 /ORGANISM="Pyrodinium bahamense, Strain pbaha01" /LENGTH=424 /DNA_ID=CAMNT_0020796363 /DNA_START=21 /DNA_END=1293 /DNA_ORIENTATION=+
MSKRRKEREFRAASSPLTISAAKPKQAIAPAAAPAARTGVASTREDAGGAAAGATPADGSGSVPRPMAAVVGPGAAGAVPAEAGCGPVGGAGAASASVSVAGDAGCNAGAPGAGTTGAGALEEAAAAGTAPAPGTSGPMRLKPGLGRVLACTPASVLTAMLPPMGAAMPIVGICMAIMLPMFIGTTPMGMAMPIGMPAPTPIGIMAIGMPVPIPIAMGIPMAIGMPGDMLPAMAMGIMPPMPMPMGIMPVTVPSLEEEPAEADDALAPPPPLAPAAAAAAAAAEAGRKASAAAAATAAALGSCKLGTEGPLLLVDDIAILDEGIDQTLLLFTRNDLASIIQLDAILELDIRLSVLPTDALVDEGALVFHLLVYVARPLLPVRDYHVGPYPETLQVMRLLLWPLPARGAAPGWPPNGPDSMAPTG